MTTNILTSRKDINLFVKAMDKINSDFNNQSSYDKERMVHINNLMENIHNLTNNIYECLVDREFDELKESVSKLNNLLKEISLSLEEDI